MDKLDLLSKQFQQEITNLLVPIQTSKFIKKTEFESMRKTLEELSKLLKDKEMVSKKLINEIYVTIKILRQEANFFEQKDKQTIEYMANKLEFLFEIILKNEILTQRKPGVPRII